MTNDAKLGLVLGVAIVLVIGLVFFRQEDLIARGSAEHGRTTALKKDSQRERTPATQIALRKSE